MDIDVSKLGVPESPHMSESPHAPIFMEPTSICHLKQVIVIFESNQMQNNKGNGPS